MSKDSNREAPFILTDTQTSTIMRDVMTALFPVCVMAVMKFGFYSLVMILTGIVSAVVFEYLYQRFTEQRTTIHDFSAAVTGLLVALSYPVTVPIWVILLGSFIAIVLIKQLAGGIGKNYLNPAVFSRVLMKILFTPIITRWVAPLPDLTSTATPLRFVSDGQKDIAEGAPILNDLFFGNIGGGIGETVKWAIILGALYLAFRRVIRIEVPLATMLGLFLITMLFGESDPVYALYHVLSGTALFAAVFMVTDYSSSPLNRQARIYFALAIGILTGFLRFSFDLPGGIGISILLMNLLAPYLDAWFPPRVFGHRGRRGVAARRGV